MEKVTSFCSVIMLVLPHNVHWRAFLKQIQLDLKCRILSVYLIANVKLDNDSSFLTTKNIFKQRQLPSILLPCTDVFLFIVNNVPMKLFALAICPQNPGTKPNPVKVGARCQRRKADRI